MLSLLKLKKEGVMSSYIKITNPEGTASLEVLGSSMDFQEIDQVIK